jgi:hypothetical protein
MTMLNKSNPEKQAEVLSLIETFSKVSYHLDFIRDTESITLYNDTTDIKITIDSYDEFIEDCAIDFFNKYTK